MRCSIKNFEAMMQGPLLSVEHEYSPLVFINKDEIKRSIATNILH